MKPATTRFSFLPNPTRLRAWVETLSHFAIGQVASQIIQFAGGFLLLRWLSYESYAQFGLAMGFQQVLGQLVDLGCTGSILALVGDRVRDPVVVGNYVHAAWALRMRLMLIFGPLSALAFVWFAHVHEWAVWPSTAIFLSIIAGLYYQGMGAVYGPVLLMHGAMRQAFTPAIVLNSGRLFLAWLLHLVSALNAAALCWLNVAVSLLTGRAYAASARPHLVIPERADPVITREFWRYLAPLLPGLIFYAVQGQVQVFLISAFGKSQQLAEVAALGRLGQLFLFLGAFNGSILIPYIARVPAKIAGSRYVLVVLVALVIAAGMSITAFLIPAPFLWLLGPKYQNLGPALGLSVAASSLAYFNATLYSLNNARRWVYHSTGIVNICGILAIQAFLIYWMPLDTTRNIMILGVATGAFPIIPFLITAVIGHRRDRANLEAAASDHAAA